MVAFERPFVGKTNSQSGYCSYEVKRRERRNAALRSMFDKPRYLFILIILSIISSNDTPIDKNPLEIMMINSDAANLINVSYRESWLGFYELNATRMTRETRSRAGTARQKEQSGD